MTVKGIKFGDINTPLLTRAVQALIKHHNAQADETNLLGNDSNVNVEIGLLRVPGNASAKPIRISIPHPLHQVDYKNGENADDLDDHLETIDVCMIVKEQSKPWVQEMVQKFPAELGCVKKVLGLASLRKKFGRHDQKRELASKYDIFMADDRILPMLGKALGKKFFETKKQPIPIKLTRKEALPFAVRNCLKATYMFIPSGRCLCIRAGNTAMPLNYLVENCENVAKEAAAKLPNKWKNITKISIKTSESVSLPFYNITPEELVEASKLVIEDDSSTQNTKKRSKTEEEQAAEEKESLAEKKRQKMEEKRQKKEAMKSPLLQALMKQKKAEKEEAQDEIPSMVKKEKKQTPAKTKKKRSNSNLGEEQKPEKKSSKKEKKSEKLATKDEETKTKKDFMASKKFKGAKKGFVFQMGKKGIGYYLDTVPIVDKSLISSLSKKGRGGRSKSQGRKSGRRGR